jgi:hypothetical protein
MTFFFCILFIFFSTFFFFLAVQGIDVFFLNKSWKFFLSLKKKNQLEPGASGSYP